MRVGLTQNLDDLPDFPTVVVFRQRVPPTRLIPIRNLMRRCIDYNSLTVCKAAFIKPMECLPVSKLPQGKQWVYEIKLDGYRAVGVKGNSDLILYSRRKRVLNKHFPEIVAALRELPPGMV